MVTQLSWRYVLDVKHIIGREAVFAAAVKTGYKFLNWNGRILMYENDEWVYTNLYVAGERIVVDTCFDDWHEGIGKVRRFAPDEKVSTI